MKIFIRIALIIAVAALLWWGINRALVQTASAARVTRGNVVYAVTGSVSVAPAESSQITSPQDGIVLASNFSLKEGQSVKAGDILAQLDPGDIPFEKSEAEIKLKEIGSELDTSNAQGGLLASEIKLKSMEKNLQDNKQQLDAGYYPPATFAEDQLAVDAQRALATSERSEKETDKSVLENSIREYDDQLRRLNIFAPYDGTITSVSAHPGDSLTKAQTVASIVSHEVKIEAEVNQDDIAAIHPGETAKIRFFAYPGAADEVPATVKTILPDSDKTTQRFTVLLEATNSPVTPISGLEGEVSFIVGEHDNVLRIPRRALYGNSVFVVSGGSVEIRQVTPGYLTLTQAEIKETPDAKQTVHEDDVVLTENLDLFRNGDPVHVSLEEAATTKSP